MGSVHAVTTSLQRWAAVLLLVGGLIHLIPPLSTGLAQLTGGTTPWIQIVIGVLSIIVALVIFAGRPVGAAEAREGSDGPALKV